MRIGDLKKAFLFLNKSIYTELEKGTAFWPTKELPSLKVHLDIKGTTQRSVIQVRTDQELVVKIRCPMRS